MPEYPGRFGSVEHVRAWFQTFFDWYCFHHHHDGLALFTPADVYYGRVPEIAAVRQAALDEAFTAHPERFVHGPPRVRLPPARAHINLRRADELQPAANSQHEVLAADQHRAAGAHEILLMSVSKSLTRSATDDSDDSLGTTSGQMISLGQTNSYNHLFSSQFADLNINK